MNQHESEQSRNEPGGTERMSVIARLPWLLAMEAVLVVVVVYPLRLKGAWLDPMVTLWREEAKTSAWSHFCLEQFASFLSFFHSPLIMKGALAAVCLVSALFLAMAGRVVQPLLGTVSQERRRTALPISAYASLWGFVGWTALTALWSPTPRVSLDGVPWVLVFGGFVYYLLRRGLNRSEVRQFAYLTTGIGSVVALISLLQARESFGGVIFNFMHKFDDPEGRNLYGSLMGHNTSVAHFMMISGLPALALAADRREGWARWWAGGYAALAGLTALVAQSRSVWGVGFALVFALLYCMARIQGRRWPWRATGYISGVLGFLIVLQLVPSRTNPFYIESNPILRRFRDLSPARLKEEARLRLVVCSLPLVAEKPVIGHGLYAFQYVYPKAQADYFIRHPDSELNRTSYRSNMAHNEYLQILVESGAVGLLLFLFFAGEVGVRGFRLSRMPDPADRLLHAAFGLAALGTCLDALVNFPFHVPQLAVPWLMNLAAFGAWREREPEPSYAGLKIQPAAAGDSGAATRLRPEYVVRLVVAWAFLFMIPMAVLTPVKMHQADINYMNGAGYVNSWRADGPRMPPSVREMFFREGGERLRLATAIQPSHDQARYSLGELHYLHGFYLAQDEQAAAAGTPPLFAAARAQMMTAIEYLTKSTASLKYHNTFFTLALCHDLLRSTAADAASRAESDRAYKENLDLCLYYAPTLFEGLALLDRWLVNQPRPDRERVTAIRRLIKRYHPGRFSEYYANQFFRRFKAQDWEEAARGADALLDVQPDNPEYLAFATDAHMYAGNRERVIQLVETLRNLKVDPVEYEREYAPYRATHSPPLSWGNCKLWALLAARDWHGAMVDLNEAWATQPHAQARFWGIQKYLREKLGIEGLDSRFEKIGEMTDAEWHAFRTEVYAEVLTYLVEDYPRARDTFEGRLAMPGRPPGLEFWINYAWLARRTGDAALLHRCVERVRELDPRHPALPRLDSPIPVPGPK